MEMIFVCAEIAAEMQIQIESKSWRMGMGCVSSNLGKMSVGTKSNNPAIDVYFAGLSIRKYERLRRTI